MLISSSKAEQGSPEVSSSAGASRWDESATTEAIKRSFLNHLKFTLAKTEEQATPFEKYFALSMAVRDRLAEQWVRTHDTYAERDVKRGYYLSMEYLLGHALSHNIINLGLERPVDRAMDELGLDRDVLDAIECDPGLGNGGLGRLAACFMDSLATLELPGFGYGLRYDYGIFRQEIRDGYQVEQADNWLRDCYPWEIKRPRFQVPVRFGGKVHVEEDGKGTQVYRWVDGEEVIGVPFDCPVVGYHNNTVNTLRLWSAKAPADFDLQCFNRGEYMLAHEQRLHSESLTRVLYPNDDFEEGKLLRFKQQYFFVACSLFDIVRRFKDKHDDFAAFPDKVAIQLNDTHPALGIAELMRIFVDEERLSWEQAWELTQATFGYTNHTLMPEALEKWPLRFFEKLLPRHLMIIYEINHRLLRHAMTRFPMDQERLKRISIIDEGEGSEKQVRMAYLSIVGSHSVNGVADLHSQLIKRYVFKDFYELWPERFNNKTNGITQRRFLLKCNPGLSELVSSKIGRAWTKELTELKKLEPLADDSEFQEQLMKVKRDNKVLLSNVISRTTGVSVDPDSLFDTQIKRLHEYKRQVLNALHVLYRYIQLRDNPSLDVQPRTFMFSGKAAAAYARAKLIIKLINDIASVVNSDNRVNSKMKVVFLPDYRVSLAERMIPATDLSEQISTAGTEASGTGNMKFALNGALTIGTLDGANVEIREKVGEENFFLFGHTVEELQALKQSEAYNPWQYYQTDEGIRQVLDVLDSDFLCLGEPQLYKPLWDGLLTEGDKYFHLADFRSYVEKQQEVDQAYQDRSRWARMCAINIANTGDFSSDRSIREYADDIWDIKPCPVPPAHDLTPR